MAHAQSIIHRDVDILYHQTWMADELDIARVALNCVALAFSFIPHTRT